MAVRSVYCPDASLRIEAQALVVTGEEQRHLTVTRVREGESVEVFDGSGRAWPGTVAGTRRSETRIEVGPVRVVPPPAKEIILAPALVRHSVFDSILERAVELGATRIVPFRAARSNITGQGRQDRWRRIVVGAAKQSKCYHLPAVDAPGDLEGVLRLDAVSRIAFSERGGGRLSAALVGAPALCLIGPEGGWTETEAGQIGSAGFSLVHLGDRILRAGTAAMLAVGLVAYELEVL